MLRVNDDAAFLALGFAHDLSNSVCGRLGKNVLSSLAFRRTGATRKAKRKSCQDYSNFTEKGFDSHLQVVHWFAVRPLSSLWCFSFSAGAPLFPIQPIFNMNQRQRRRFSPVSWHFRDGLFWMRIFGLGISIKNTKKHPALFSERAGFGSFVRVGKWIIKPLSIN